MEVEKSDEPLEESSALEMTPPQPSKWCPPPLFGKVTLNVIMATWFLIACITSVVLTNKNYNTEPSQNWMLVGGLTPTSATFRLRQQEGADEEIFVVSRDPLTNQGDDAVGVVFSQPLSSLENNNTDNADDGAQPLLVHSISVDSLESDTKYYFGTISASKVVQRQGSFRTAPPTGQRTNFKFATAGCAMMGSEHAIFSKIKKEEPLFFLHLGDFHYLDINSEDVAVRIDGIDKVLGSASQADLFSSTAMAVMWDDHDWLGNDSLGYAKGRQAALDSYRQAFPFPVPLPSNNSMYHAFTIGTVRFVISDLRSERTPESMFSAQQRDWLYNEIAQADQYDFIVWVTTFPWIGDSKEGDDSWLGYPEDRRNLSDWISSNLATKQNLLALSADAHMVAFDDGSHSYYGTSEAAADTLSFPVLQSGPLDRLGSVKGGPYSGGCTTYKYERNHQYSVVEFTTQEGADEPCLEIKSYRLAGSEKEEILSRKLCGQIFSSSQYATEGQCDAPLFSKTNKALVASASCMFLIIIIQSCFLGDGWFGAFAVSAIVLIWFTMSFVAAFFIPQAQGYAQFDTFETSLIGLLQMLTSVLYLSCWIYRRKNVNPSL